jgi:hypothetical protein
MPYSMSLYRAIAARDDAVCDPTEPKELTMGRKW